MTDAATFVGSTLFALICLFGGRLGARLEARGAALLSASTGVGVAYLFVDIMPHLASKQEKLLSATDIGFYGFLEHHAYLVALCGFCLFYLSSMLATRRTESRHTERLVHHMPGAVRAYIMAGAASYFGLISYMLGEQPDHRAEPLVLFTSAMAIHAVGLTHFLRNRLVATYERTDRFVLAGAAWAGWLLAEQIDVLDVVYALWFSLLAGGIFGVVAAELAVINTLRRLAHLVVGAAVFSTLLVLVERYSSLD